MMWVSYATQKKKKQEKFNWITKGTKMNKGEKRTTQLILLTGVDWGLNNRKITLRGMVIKET
jgi:hypothetical protein